MTKEKLTDKQLAETFGMAFNFPIKCIIQKTRDEMLDDIDFILCRCDNLDDFKMGYRELKTKKKYGVENGT